MNRIEIESLTVEELKEIIAEVVAEGLEDYFSRDPQQDEFLSRKEVADYFKVSIVTIDIWGKREILKPYKIGSRTLFKRSDLKKAIKQQLF